MNNEEDYPIWCPECNMVKKFTYCTIGTRTGAVNGWMCEEEIKNGHKDLKE